MAAVGGDAGDGALVALQLPQGPQRVGVPQLQHAAPAAAQQHRGPGDHAQRTHPVTVGVGDLLLERSSSTEGSFGLTRTSCRRLRPYLQQVFTLQVPLLDAVVPRAAEEHVSLHHQGLDAVVVRRLKVVRGADAPQGAFGHVEQL